MENNNSKQNPLKREHQDPQGNLKKTNIPEQELAPDQDSLGFLKKPAPPLTSPREYIDLPLADIEHYKGIEDYIKLTTSPCPSVVRTPNHCHCIDGYNLVEKARQEGSKTILCHVFNEADEVSESDLALRKTGTRLISEQGKPYYAEKIRNCKKVLALLEQTTENPVMNSHGGVRKGDGYIPNNKEDDLRALMAERLGQAIKTTAKYICYGEYLDDEILETLVQSKVTRDFFDQSAPNKTRLVKNLRSDEKNDLEITAEVSKKMADWLEEYRENKEKITPLFSEKKTEPKKMKCLIHPPKLFSHHGEYDTNLVENTGKSLNQEIKSLLEGLFAFVSEDNAENKEEYVATLKGGAGDFVTLISKFEALKANTATVSTKEVA